MKPRKLLRCITLNESADARAIWRGHDLYLSYTGTSEDLTIREKSQVCASFVSWGLLVLPVNKPEGIVLVLC